MTQIPQDAKRIPVRPLALGEVTGHHHSLISDEANIEMYEKDGEIYVRVNEAVPLQHQEHKPIMVPSGCEASIRIATEVTDWGRAPVRD